MLGLMQHHLLFWPLIHLLKIFPHPFQKWPKISSKEDCPSVYPFDEIPVAELGCKKFSHLSAIFFFSFFLSSPLVWWCLLLIFQSICKFPFLQVFWFFLKLTILFFPLFVFLLLLLLLVIWNPYSCVQIACIRWECLINKITDIK